MKKLQVAITLLLVVSISGCDFGCADQVRATIPSPSGAIKVVVFNRNCGATTGFNTQVSLLASDATLSGGGNTLILDGTVPLKIQWVSKSTLSITGIGSARVFKKKKRVAGVKVTYGN